METNHQLILAREFVENTGQNVFLTGKAGTGKTTFLKHLQRQSLKRMIVVAPTGVAAINAGGVTIHSFFQLSFAPQVGNESEQNNHKRFNKTKINIIRSLDLLVIDEISMVRADILDAIDRVLRRYRRKNKPFGGVQLLMIGDLRQLAPVIKDDEWNILRQVYESVYFFSSQALQRTSYVSIELTHVYRQQDDRFIKVLNKVRDNKLDREAAEILNQRYIPDFEVPQDSDYITLCTHNVQAKRLNENALAKLTTREGIMRATVEGNFPEYAYPTDEELHLKEGAQVMFVKNDHNPEKRFYNGKIGKVTHLSKNELRVLCPGDEEEIEVEPLVWENVKYSIDEKTAEIKEEVEGTFKQIPLKTAWAITIHKSQGLTFEHAVIDAHASFAHGQVYVALSRCRTLEGLVLSTPISERSIISDNTINHFIHDIEENQPDATVLDNCRNAFQHEVIKDVFDFSDMLFAIRGIARIANENTGAFPKNFPTQINDVNVAITQHLDNVARTFDRQVAQLLAHNPDAECNAELQERISKASTYFYDKMQEVLVSKLSLFGFEIDNKTIAKQLNNYIDNLQTEINIALALFEACQNGFSIKKVMDIRAQRAIQKKEKPKRTSSEPTNFENVEHAELFYELRRYRSDKSAEIGRPAYHIFSQKTLAELLEYLPVDLKMLSGIKGFGATKVKQFGQEIIEIIAAYCRENGIDRGQVEAIEFPEIKKKKPKVDTKKVSLDLYKNGMALEEIAKERSLTEDTISKHLCHYIALGEVDGKEVLPAEKLDKLLDFFSKNNNEYSMKPAYEYFKEKMSYAEIRLGFAVYLASK